MTLTTRPASSSNPQRTTAASAITKSATPVLVASCFGVGHTTFFSSLLSSRNHFPMRWKKPSFFSSFLTALVFLTGAAFFFSSAIFYTHPFRKLLGFDMLGVLSAERAILASLKLFGSILLVLDSVVVPLLALITSKCDLDSVVSHTFRHLLFYLSALRCGHLPPCMGIRIPACAQISARKKTSRPTGNH